MTPEARELIRAVAGDPAKAADVPLDKVPALLAQLAAVQVALLGRLVAEGNGHGDSGAAGPDRNLSVEEAAQALGMSPAYLYRRAGSLPFTVRIGRRLLFSAAGLERWNRRRQGR